MKFCYIGQCNTCGEEEVKLYSHSYNKRSQYEDCENCVQYHKEIYEEEENLAIDINLIKRDKNWIEEGFW